MENLGTHATYQGIPCADVAFRDARGIASPASEVVIPAPPIDPTGAGGFTWSGWVAAQLQLPAAPEVPPDLARSFTGGPRPALELAQGLRAEGSLVLAEDPSEPLVIPGLTITRVEAIDLLQADKVVRFYKLELVDWRFFLGRGASPKQSWNVLRQDGTLRLDTAKPDGKAYTLAEVVEELREGIWRHPEIARVPSVWRKLTRELRFPPFTPTRQVLEAIAALGGAVQPCKHLDGRLAFYLKGEGKVGWARKGVGENTEDLPPGKASGRGLSWEANWPEEFVMVVGGPRVATVAVDDAEPVLMIDGVPVLLNEGRVRHLTGQRHGLEWLHKLLMLPPSDHYSEGVPEVVVKLLTEQAYLYYRVRGVEKVATTNLGEAEDASSGPRGAAPAGSGVESYTGEPGPNAHLLPLLDRAELSGASRRTPTVEAYSWDTQRKRFRAVSETGQKLTQALAELDRIRQDVKAELLRRGSFSNPLEQARAPLATDSAARNALELTARHGLSLGNMIGFLSIPEGLDRALVESYLAELRRIALLKKSLPEEAAAYEQQLAQKIAAESAQGDGTAQIAFDLAKQLFGWETQAAGTSHTEAGLREDFAATYGARARGAVQQAANRMIEARKAFAARKEAGVAGVQFLERVHLRNKVRRVDAGAAVVSRELGVVKLSTRGGHVEKEDVSDPSLTRFVPRPVRIVFGAVARPRIDRQDGRVPTGVRKDPFGGRDFIPPVLSERESTYTVTFRRTGVGQVEQVLGAPLDRVTPIYRPDWQEMIPLLSGAEAETQVGPDGAPVARDQAGAPDVAGVSNKPELDEEARKLAVQISLTPDRTRAEPLELVGPWPVQCNGVVAAVEIVMEKKGDAPCGFTTRVLIDSESTVPAEGTRERRRSR